MHPLRRLTRPERDRSGHHRGRARDALGTAGWIAERPDSERDAAPLARAIADAVVEAYLALDALGGDTRAVLADAVRRQPQRPRPRRRDRQPTATIPPIDSADWKSGAAALAYRSDGALYARTPTGVVVLGAPVTPRPTDPGPNAYCDGDHLAGPHNDNLRADGERTAPGGITVTDDTHRPPNMQEAPPAVRVAHEHERWQIRDDGDGHFYCGACGVPVPAPGTVGCG